MKTLLPSYINLKGQRSVLQALQCHRGENMLNYSLCLGDFSSDGLTSCQFLVLTILSMSHSLCPEAPALLLGL